MEDKDLLDSKSLPKSTKISTSFDSVLSQLKKEAQIIVDEAAVNQALQKSNLP
jgi:hypothetical protein